MNDSYTVAILGPSTSDKPEIVLEKLHQSNHFSEKYTLFGIVDNKEGKFVDKLVNERITYEVVEEPADLYSTLNKLPIEELDFLVACGWIYKIPKRVIELPTQGALNCHSSYLPDYRGRSVYWHQWAKAEEFGGATVHYLSDEIDKGNIIAQDWFRISMCDSPYDIRDHVSEMTAPLLRESMELVLDGYKGTPQKTDQGNYYPYKHLNTYHIHMIRAINIFLRLLKSEKRIDTRK